MEEIEFEPGPILILLCLFHWALLLVVKGVGYGGAHPTGKLRSGTVGKWPGQALGEVSGRMSAANL